MRGNWKWFAPTVTDLVRVKEQSAFPEVKLDTDDFIMHMNPTLQDVTEYLHSFRMDEPVSVDIETKKDIKQIVCVGFAQGKEAMSIPLFAYGRANNCYWHILEEEAEVWRLISMVLTDEKLEKIFQNWMYDAYWFRYYGIKVMGRIWDTMLMHHCRYHELRHGLDFLTSIYTTIPYYKDEGKEYDPKLPNERFWRYNCLDVLGPVIIREELEKELREANLLDYYFEWYEQLLWPYLNKAFNGLNVDRPFLDAQTSFWKGRRDELQAQLNDMVGFELNVKSSEQCCDYFYDKLHMPTQYKRGTRTRTFDRIASQISAT
jgi:DNA polymerase I-like protein with 3'-5' exonuclease and polymerase domains